MGARPQTDPRMIEARRKDAEALEHRRKGKSYAAIGKAMNVSTQYAFKLVQRGLNRLLKRCDDGAKAIRKLEEDRLDEMLAGIYQAATTGDAEAIRTALQIMARRAKLRGIDAPTKVEQKVSFDNLTDEQLKEEARRLNIPVGETGSGDNEPGTD